MAKTQTPVAPDYTIAERRQHSKGLDTSDLAVIHRELSLSFFYLSRPFISIELK